MTTALHGRLAALVDAFPQASDAKPLRAVTLGEARELFAQADELREALAAALPYLEAYARSRPEPFAPLPALDAARAALAAFAA